jgi:hypothetical protein
VPSHHYRATSQHRADQNVLVMAEDENFAVLSQHVADVFICHFDLRAARIVEQQKLPKIIPNITN